MEKVERDKLFDPPFRIVNARTGNSAASSSPIFSTKHDVFAVIYGLFLGLSLLKFGNPVILHDKIIAPASLAEAWRDPWPTRWAFWPMAVLTCVGLVWCATEKRSWKGRKLFWILPLIWFGWQLVSGTQSVDRTLTGWTILHFGGCCAAYFLGALLFRQKRALGCVLGGVLAAFAVCSVRAVNQRIEFPRDLQQLLEGQRTGWTNFPPEILQSMKRDGTIITTNGVDVANPLFVTKLRKGRVHGTLVYPNALAGASLLLTPIALVLAFRRRPGFRPWLRAVVIALAVFLGVGSLFWSGSKSGWLIALMMVGCCLFRLNWPRHWKWLVLVAVVTGGMVVFGVRFRAYFASGATSVGARFDYWRAALAIAASQPVFGSGPGTFQRPYARLKAPEAEMARLVHNDFLEQFSDSGLIGGLSYLSWLAILFAELGRQVWRRGDPFVFALFLGLFGWFAQGFTEFGLYIPALAWTSFTLLGTLLALSETDRHRLKAPLLSRTRV